MGRRHRHEGLQMVPVPAHYRQKLAGGLRTRWAGSALVQLSFFPCAEQQVCKNPCGFHHVLHLKHQLEQLSPASAHIPHRGGFPKPYSIVSTGRNDSPTAGLHPSNPPSAQVWQLLGWSLAARSPRDLQCWLHGPPKNRPPPGLAPTLVFSAGGSSFRASGALP